MKKTLLFAAIVVALLAVVSMARAQTKTFQFTFVNHINVQLSFSVDDNYACTANAGMECYSTVAVGPHDFKALDGNNVIKHVEATLNDDADNPTWVICYSENGTCG